MSALPVRRLASLAAGLALAAAVLAGCSSEGATTECPRIDECTVTFDRGVEANANILGIEAKLVGVEGEVATVEVAGQKVSLTVGQQATEVAGLQVSLQSVTDSKIQVRIAR